MNGEFIKTQVTLLQRIAIEKTGQDDASWARFFELYYPAMLVFAKGIGCKDSAEDIVQDVLVKLVDVLRNGKYEHRQGHSFRGYLKALIRNRMYDLYRSECVRGGGKKISLTEEVIENTTGVEDDIGKKLDIAWARACRESAINHVLTKMAHSAQTKAVYRAYVLEERPIGEVAKEFGISRNMVSQIKTRLDRIVESIVAEYGV